MYLPSFQRFTSSVYLTHRLEFLINNIFSRKHILKTVENIYIPKIKIHKNSQENVQNCQQFCSQTMCRFKTSLSARVINHTIHCLRGKKLEQATVKFEEAVSCCINDRNLLSFLWQFYFFLISWCLFVPFVVLPQIQIGMTVGHFGIVECTKC